MKTMEKPAPGERCRAGADSACDALGAALVLGRDPEAWAALGAIWRHRLTEAERAAVAWAALRSLPPDARLAILGALDPNAGPPLPPIQPPMQAARWWATIASRAELRAYAAAAFQALPASDRGRFLAWASTPREVAA